MHLESVDTPVAQKPAWTALRWDDYALLLIVLALTSLGIVVLLSSTYVLDSADAFAMLKKQAVWLVVASLAGLIAWRIDVHELRDLVWWLAVPAILLCALVFIPPFGREINGANRWLILGPFRFQVAEAVKVALVFILAHYLAENKRKLNEKIRGVIFPGLIIGVAFGMILLQPDYGTAFLCALVGGCMLYLAGGALKYWVPLGILGLAGFATLIYHNPERLSRVTSFLSLNSEVVRGDEGYQLWQGILGFASGGMSGVGLGDGRQQITYLPEAHTDFIFSIVGEELGLIFTLLIVILFLALFFLVALRIRRATSLYECLLVQGSLLFIVFQALINMGVVTGVLPTKGMSLPFISYGGSYLILMFFFIGLIINVSSRWSAVPKRERVRSE